MPETSEPDNLQQQKQQSAPPKSAAGKAWNYIKSRFNQDNWFGSLLTPLGFYVNYTTIKSAQTRKVHGIQDQDRIRELSPKISMAEGAWSFFSARGGKFPEGRTALQRIINALKHPQISSTQFGWLVNFPNAFMNDANHITKGLKAYGIGLKEGETAYTPEKIRLYSGLHQLITIILIGVGHFKKHPAGNVDNTQHEQLSDNPDKEHNMFHIIGKMWKYDRILLIGSFLNMFSPLYGAVEPWKKWHESRLEAIYLAKGSLFNCLIVAAQGLYTFQRIAKSNYRSNVMIEEEGASPQEIKELEEIPDRQPRSVNFSARYAEPQPAMAMSR